MRNSLGDKLQTKKIYLFIIGGLLIVLLIILLSGSLYKVEIKDTSIQGIKTGKGYIYKINKFTGKTYVNKIEDLISPPKSENELQEIPDVDIEKLRMEEDMFQEPSYITIYNPTLWIITEVFLQYAAEKIVIKAVTTQALPLEATTFELRTAGGAIEKIKLQSELDRLFPPKIGEIVNESDVLSSKDWHIIGARGYRCKDKLIEQMIQKMDSSK